jgi:large subunit ribosomal protein L1
MAKKAAKPDAPAEEGAAPAAPEKAKAEKPEKGAAKAEKAEKADKGAQPEKEAKKPAGKVKAPKPGPETAAPAKTAPEAPPAAPAAAPAAPAPGAADAPSKQKGKRPGVAPPLSKKTKATLKNIEEKIQKQGEFTLKQAVTFLKENKRAKFDETVEIHMSLGIDPKQSDQMVRGSVPLPHGIGKSVRLVVFAQGENAAKAKEAGADFVGADDIAQKIQKEGFLDFDAALATPDMMSVVGRLGKILGPRGLMPSPKAGTVITGDISAAVKEFKAGKVEFRADTGGNVHAPIGKLSFDEPKLSANIQAFIDQVRAAKPPSSKGNYVKSITVSATMSPGIRIQA